MPFDSPGLRPRHRHAMRWRSDGGAEFGADLDERDMDVVAEFRGRIADALTELLADGSLPSGLDLGRFRVSPAPASAGAHLWTDAGPAYGSNFSGGASGLADALASRLRRDGDIEAVSSSGSGLLHLTLQSRVLASIVSATLASTAGHGAIDQRGCAKGRRSTASSKRLDCTSPAFRVEAVADAVARSKAAAGHRAMAERVAVVEWIGSADHRPRPAPLSASASSGRSARLLFQSGRVGGEVVVVVGPWSLHGLVADEADARDFVGTIDRDALRIALLMVPTDRAVTLDLATVEDLSHASPAFHIRYAHARACGVLRLAARTCPDRILTPAALASVDFTELSDSGEQRLLRLVARHPHMVARASEACQPHRLALHLHELATAFHDQWRRSKEQPQLRFVNEKRRVSTEARLGLVMAIARVLKSGLAILGASAPDELR